MQKFWKEIIRFFKHCLDYVKYENVAVVILQNEWVDYQSSPTKCKIIELKKTADIMKAFNINGRTVSIIADIMREYKIQIIH